MNDNNDKSKQSIKKILLKTNFLALTRISLGWIFLWAFLDKTFGLGYTTSAEASWLNNGNPIYGYLTFATSGPFADSFQQIAESTFFQWLFMLALLGIGLSLTLAIGLKITAYAGTFLLTMMYISALPFYAEGSHNPFVDDHVVYAFLILYIAFTTEDHVFSFHNKWSEMGLVKKYPILK